MKYLILSQPKSGTYLASNLLKNLDINQSFIHLSLEKYEDYTNADLDHAKNNPKKYSHKLNLSESVKLIKDGFFAVGHIPCTNETQAILKDFKKGHIQILISTLLNEGFDFKGLRAVFNAAGGKSEKQTIQRLGRALRSEDGKYVGVCVDVLDRIVVEESNQSLHRHALARKKTYKDMGFNVKVFK